MKKNSFVSKEKISALSLKVVIHTEKVKDLGFDIFMNEFDKFRTNEEDKLVVEKIFVYT